MSDKLYVPAAWTLPLPPPNATIRPASGYGRLIAEPRRRRLALALSHGEIRVRDMVCGLLERVCGRLAPWR